MATSGLFPAHKLPSIDLARRLGIKDPIDFQALSDQFDCLRNFERVGIIYDDGYSRWLVRPSRRYASITNNVVTHVVITKAREAAYQPEKKIFDTLRSPEFANELTSTALACGGAAVSYMLTFTATAAIPFTAGTSGIVAVIAKTGAYATGAQCVNGLIRLYSMTYGDGEYKWLDNQGWYQTTTTILDTMSLASAGAGLKKSIDVYRNLKKSSPRAALDWLRGMPRTERKRLTDEIIKAQNPGISQGGIKAAKIAGLYPKRFPNESIRKSLQRELWESVTWTTAFAGSALSGNIRNPGNMPASGVYLISLVHSFST